MPRASRAHISPRSRLRNSTISELLVPERSVEEQRERLRYLQLRTSCALANKKLARSAAKLVKHPLNIVGPKSLLVRTPPILDVTNYKLLCATSHRLKPNFGLNMRMQRVTIDDDFVS